MFVEKCPQRKIPCHFKSASYARQRACVLEYLVYPVAEREIRWQGLVENQYQPIPMEPDGIIRSNSFPGLWLNVQAFLDGEMRLVFETLQEGLDSEKHADFIEYLKSASEK